MQSAFLSAADHRANAKVAVVRCATYDESLKSAYESCFDLLGGIGPMVRNKTVTIKINLTGTPYRDMFGRTSGETYLTHGNTVNALTAVLFEAGAKRVRIVECANYLEDMESILEYAGFRVSELLSLGNVEVENTRNLGKGRNYAKFPVPNGGYLFSAFELNHSYADTDVFVSLAKLKNHSCAGVTLAMKNIFGITPNSIYGEDAGNENATQGRARLHMAGGWGRWRKNQGEQALLPHEKAGDFPNEQGYRIPRVIVDLCAARPIHLSIIDGITSISGGEGPWCSRLKFTTPGVLIAGLNPVSTDAIGLAIMGYKNSQAERGEAPFYDGDNHLLLAEQAGIGIADLAQIDVRGLSLDEAIYPYESAGS